MKKAFIYFGIIFFVFVFFIPDVIAYNNDSIRLIKGTYYISKIYMSVEAFKEKNGVNEIPGNRAVIFDKQFILDKVGSKISFDVKTSIKTAKDTNGNLWGQSIYIMLLSKKEREGFVASNLDYIAKLKIINSTKTNLKNRGNAIYPSKGNKINSDVILDNNAWNEISLIRTNIRKGIIDVYINGKKLAELSNVPSKFYILLGTDVNRKFYLGSILRIIEPKVFRVKLY